MIYLYVVDEIETFLMTSRWCHVSFVCKMSGTTFTFWSGAFSIHNETSNNLLKRQRKDHKYLSHIDFYKSIFL